MSDIEDEPPPVLLPCTICSRTFRPEVLERHAKVCEKTANKKRRVFDSFKNRVSGTELEEFLGPAPLPGQIVKRPIKSPVKKKGPPKWKETHENLIAVLRAARGVTQPLDTAIEPAKHGGNEQCPSCNRFFGPRAFDRHVEFCKEKTARIKMTPSKVSQAQERLEARTKYRAPLSIKPKLTTKEKYSPMLTRKESTESCSLSTSSTKTSPPVPALNKNAKVVKQNSSNFSRQSPVRSSERLRSISPNKKATNSSSKTQTKSSQQPKAKENLKDHDDLRPRTGNKPLTQERLRKSQTEDSYDPFKQAERQMLALLSWPSTADIKTLQDFTPQSKSKTNKNQNLESSPTSAFSKYPSKDDKSGKTKKSSISAKKNLNGEFQRENSTNKNNKDLKPTYTSADDWEQIFEKHFDVNRNEMTEEITKSVKSALDGLLKYTTKKSPNTSDKKESTTPPDLSENSIITEVLYTSTPKQNSKSDKTVQSRSKDKTVDLDQTPTSRQKNSNFSYGRITPPEDFNEALGKIRRDEKNKRNSGISLSSLSFCSRISDTTLADEEVLMSNLEIIEKAAAAVVAPRTPRRKYARSQSVFDERNKMLFAKTYDHNFSSSDDGDVEVLPKIVDKQGSKSPSRNPYPKPVPFNYYRSQSVTGNKCKGDGDHTDEGDHISSPENNRRKKSKFSGDSAYSSLNRRSPRQNVQPKQEGMPSAQVDQSTL